MAYCESTALTDNGVRKQIAMYLWRRNKESFFLYSLITATGIDFNDAVNLKVSDVFGKKTLTYISHQGIKRAEPIPEDLQIFLSDFCREKDKDSFLLVGKNNKRPFHASTFIQILGEASEKLGLSVPLSVRTFKKTYFYQKLIHEGYDAIRPLIHYKSEKRICEYLGVTLEEVQSEMERAAGEREPKTGESAGEGSGTMEEGLRRKLMTEWLSFGERPREGRNTPVPGLVLPACQEMASVSDRLSLALSGAEKAIAKGACDEQYLRALKTLCLAVNDALAEFEKSSLL